MKRVQKFQSRLIAMVAGALASSACLHAQIQVPPTPPTVPNPDGPSVSILATDPYALEGTSSGAFTLLRTGPATNDLTVDLIIGGTASNGVDYVQISSTQTIPTGDLAIDIAVNPIVDLTTRGNKTVVLSVVNTNSAYAVRGLQRATVTIVDDVYNILPPTISLVSPANGSVYGSSSPIVFEADASGLGDNVQYVSFFLDDMVLGRASNGPPYSITWTNPCPGKFVAFARAVDQVGQSTLTAPSHFTVTNDAPSVKITSPTNGENFTAHSPITLTATAGATAVTVSFYDNGHMLGTATNPPPFSLTWTNPLAGIHILRATATDATGEKGYSGPVLINVSKP